MVSIPVGAPRVACYQPLPDRRIKLIAGLTTFVWEFYWFVYSHSIHNQFNPVLDETRPASRNHSSCSCPLARFIQRFIFTMPTKMKEHLENTVKLLAWTEQIILTILFFNPRYYWTDIVWFSKWTVICRAFSSSSNFCLQKYNCKNPQCVNACNIHLFCYLMDPKFYPISPKHKMVLLLNYQNNFRIHIGSSLR